MYTSEELKDEINFNDLRLRRHRSGIKIHKQLVLSTISNYYFLLTYNLSRDHKQILELILEL